MSSFKNFFSDIVFRICLVLSLCSTSISSPVILEDKLVEKLNTSEVYCSTSMVFAGDMMFDRYVRVMSQRYGKGFILSRVRDCLAEFDYVAANLEGPISRYKSLSMGSKPGSPENFIFTFDPYTAEMLADFNIRIVNLGNNHILNFGKQGFLQTLEYLQKAGIEYFGYIGEVEFDKVLVLKKDCLKIGLVNYNQFSKGSFEKTLENIKDYRGKVDFLIVYTHWGVEYAGKAPKSIVQKGRRFAKAGADLVVGSHPHVVQNWEDYGRTRIYYSLGNFVFDQYFSDEVKRGMLVELYLEKKESSNSIRVDYNEKFVDIKINSPIEIINRE